MDNRRDGMRSNNSENRSRRGPENRPPVRGPKNQRSRPRGANPRQGRPPQQQAARAGQRPPVKRQQDPRRQAAAAANSAIRNERQASRPRPETRPAKSPNRKSTKLLIILIDVIIIGLILAAVFFIVYPRWLNDRQKEIRDNILSDLKKKKGDVTIEIGKDDYKVPGERLEAWSVQDGDDFATEVDVKGGKVQITYIGRLVIAKIGCDTPLSGFTDMYHLRFGSSILHTSPALAAKGQTVIFGHRFLDKGRDFNRLDEVVAGDTFFIDIAKENLRYHYRVDKQLIIPDVDLPSYVYPPDFISPGYSADDNTVLLVTCHPAIYGASDERLLVYAHLEKTEAIPEE